MEHQPSTPRRTCLSVVVTAVLSVAAMSPANATHYYGSAVLAVRATGQGYHGLEENGTGVTIDSGHNDVTGGVYAFASSADNGTLQVAADVEDSAFAGSAEAELDYTFEIVANAGVTPAGTVPLRVVAAATAQATDSFQIIQEAAFRVTQAGNGDGIGEDYYGYPWDRGDDPTIWSVNRYVDFQPGVPISVYMHAAVGASTGRLKGAVTVDPLFELDPAFASQYQLVGLPDNPTGGAPALPEPSSWAMMVGGFGLLGGMLRRRRPAVQSPTM